MYAKYIKRLLDFVLSVCALIILSPFLIVFMVLGAVNMNGNPFFAQQRPGKGEKIFCLIKFRTMTCEKDENGELLSDEMRLTKYGKWLRSTSIDELPELINIIKGDMSVIGPRPLLVRYLPLYNDRQRRRHEVRPGLTGLAQVRGRNTISWQQKFDDDVEYVDNITFWGDVKILLATVAKVLKREGICDESSETMTAFEGNEEKEHINVR